MITCVVVVSLSPPCCVSFHNYCAMMFKLAHIVFLNDILRYVVQIDAHVFCVG